MTTRKRRSAGPDVPMCNHGGGHYEIRIKGTLDEHWLDWFEGMTLQRAKDLNTGIDVTVLRGTFADQPALHGVLAKIRDLNLTLISVTKPSPAKPKSRPRRFRPRRARPKPR